MWDANNKKQKSGWGQDGDVTPSTRRPNVLPEPTDQRSIPVDIVIFYAGSPARTMQPLEPLPTSSMQLQCNAARTEGSSSVLDTNPRGVGGGSGRGGGGQSKIFLHFGGISPRFILSILNIHKWGEIWFYPSQQMKNSTIVQQMYL